MRLAITIMLGVCLIAGYAVEGNATRGRSECYGCRTYLPGRPLVFRPWRPERTPRYHPRTYPW